MLFLNHRSKVALTLFLCVFACVVFIPSLAFGQTEAGPVDAERLIALVKEHAWPIVAAIVIGFLVRLVKEEKIPINVAPRFRPLLAVGLGVVSAICEAVIAGTPVLTAAIGGLASSVAAIGGHDVIIEAIFGGKEPTIGKSGGVVGLILGALLALSQTGCGASMQTIEVMADDAGDGLAAGATLATSCDKAMTDRKDLRTGKVAPCKPDDAACIAAADVESKEADEAFRTIRRLFCKYAPEGTCS